MTKLNSEQIDGFATILITIMEKLGFDGKIVSHYNTIRKDEITFRFKTVDDLDAIYHQIEDSYDTIRNTVNSRHLAMRKYNGKLELRFPRIVVRLQSLIEVFNPKLELD